MDTLLESLGFAVLALLWTLYQCAKISVPLILIVYALAYGVSLW